MEEREIDCAAKNVSRITVGMRLGAAMSKKAFNYETVCDTTYKSGIYAKVDHIIKMVNG